MSQDPSLPEVHEAFLDKTTFDALFDDLEGCAEVLDVLLKGGLTEHAAEESVPLRDAQTLLVARAVLGVQIRYRWEGAEWRDTLLRMPLGVRIVRMKME